MDKIITKKIAIVSCMDDRLNVYKIFNLMEGKAYVIRNAGGVVTEDVMRSLAFCQLYLNIEKIILLTHTMCLARKYNNEIFKRNLIEKTGIIPTWDDTKTYLTIEDQFQEYANIIRQSPYIDKNIIINGFIFDVETKKLISVNFK